MSGAHDEDIYNKPFSIRVWAKMGRFFRPLRALLIASSLLMLVSSALDVAMPIFQRWVIDRFIVAKTTDGLVGASAIGGAIVISQMIVTMIFTRMAIRVEMGFSRDLKRACFDHLQVLSLTYYNKTPVGTMISRVLSDTDRIGLVVAWGFIDAIWGVSYILFAVGSMLVLDLRLGLYLAAMLPILAVVTSFFQNKILKSNRRARYENSLVTGAFNEGITGARTSKTLANEPICAASFDRLATDLRGSMVRVGMLNSIYLPVMLMIGAFAAAIMVTRGGLYVNDGSLDLGTLSAMVSYAINIFHPIQQLSRLLSDSTAAQANIERVSALLAEEPEITDSPEVIEKYGTSFEPKFENWEPLRGEIEFRGVSFRYPGTEAIVIEDLDLFVPAGTTVAIVGETGAGKSTIVNLICRFFEPTKGAIFVDGRDMRERSQLWMRSNIGCVLQSPHLFSGSVRDNIRYARPDASDDEVMRAARLVSADRVIERIEGGLGGEIGEGGCDLSTGEKQLLSFARAMLADPPIFILDEATSSIDTETERSIQRAISRVLEGRTSFIIAHRLSTIKMADVILVVHGGRIIERGTHAELMALRGAYHAMIEEQYASGAVV